MPSIDRVGRHFPFTIAADLSHEAGLSMIADARWFENLEGLALSTLEEPFDLEAFDASLEQLRLPSPPESPTSKLRSAQNETDFLVFGLASMDSLSSALPSIAQSLLQESSARLTFWWTSGSDRVRPCLVTCRGLPNASSFSAFLDGNWNRWGLTAWL
jgi:type VI secretion system protein ImpM